MTRTTRSHTLKTHSHSAASVSIHVRDLSQMFSSLDPSPFWDRDLDHNAAAFIEDEFSDKRSAGVWHLHVHTQGDSALAGDLQTALEKLLRPDGNGGPARAGRASPYGPHRIAGGRLYERLAGVRVAVRSDPPVLASVSAG
jgi:hypothetical protein